MPRAVRPVLPTTTRIWTDGRGRGTSCTHGQANVPARKRSQGIITTNSASDSLTTGQWPSFQSTFPIRMLPKLGCHRRKSTKPGPSLRKVCHAVLSRFSHVWLFVTLQIVAHQPTGSYRLSCPPPEDLPDKGIKPTSLKSPVLAVGSLPLAPSGKPQGKSEDAVISENVFILWYSILLLCLFSPMVLRAELKLGDGKQSLD